MLPLEWLTFGNSITLFSCLNISNLNKFDKYNSNPFGWNRHSLQWFIWLFFSHAVGKNIASVQKLSVAASFLLSKERKYCNQHAYQNLKSASDKFYCIRLASWFGNAKKIPNADQHVFRAEFCERGKMKHVFIN